MEAKRHLPDHNAFPPSPGTPVQSIVELIKVCASGLVFWSRQQFEIASELQIRLETEALATAKLDAGLKARDGWVVIRGFVVGSKPARKPDGTVGFEVTLVFEPVMPGKRARKDSHSPKLISPDGYGLN